MGLDGVVCHMAFIWAFCSMFSMCCKQQWIKSEPDLPNSVLSCSVLVESGPTSKNSVGVAVPLFFAKAQQNINVEDRGADKGRGSYFW
ncbi:hypothetical protein BX070DRAFT_230507 [Coemansia spiralis]|nr:hypothetical protein BX070DRAFT_230507 [Coemansia spiralis]